MTTTAATETRYSELERKLAAGIAADIRQLGFYEPKTSEAMIYSPARRTGPCCIKYNPTAHAMVGEMTRRYNLIDSLLLRHLSGVAANAAMLTKEQADQLDMPAGTWYSAVYWNDAHSKEQVLFVLDEIAADKPHDRQAMLDLA